MRETKAGGMRESVVEGVGGGGRQGKRREDGGGGGGDN